ncbi:MAG: hypothetical protein JO235_28450 [Chroococcidiopsidaceae cyanobacterium CP_BM_RX_35]|nr:hypothetical protein [Chroococcidiopsidaceae cyanobacterium CP_BM_RX_35]
MTTNSVDCDRTFPHGMQTSFYATTVVFNLCLIAQLLTVGLPTSMILPGGIFMFG